MIQINRTWSTYEKEQGKRFVYEVKNVMPTMDRDAWETNASWNEYWTLYVPQVKQDRAMAEGPRKRKCREDVGKATAVVEEKERRREALGLIQYMWRGFFRAYLIRVV
jgi:hypothetical protein